MRLLVLSDLHHELWREQAPRIGPAVSQPDVVILAGDINTGPKAVEWAARTFPGLPVHALSSAAYASRLDELAAKADLWIHGHMHESFDYAIGRCRVVCNPCGYMNRAGGTENERFDSNFIVEIG